MKKVWAGCGYHFFVRKNGTVYRGKDEEVVGTHCKGYNTGALGICLEGNYMVDDMQEVQRKAVIELCRHLVGKYSIKKIYGHMKFVKTDCQGGKFPLLEIIDEVFNDFTVNDLYPGYLIRKNSSKYDKNVMKIQQQLVELGYDVGACGIDGYFGRDTERAVMEFQEDSKIQIDGVVGAVTWGRVFG